MRRVQFRMQKSEFSSLVQKAQAMLRLLCDPSRFEDTKFRKNGREDSDVGVLCCVDGFENGPVFVALQGVKDHINDWTDVFFGFTNVSARRRGAVRN